MYNLPQTHFLMALPKPKAQVWVPDPSLMHVGRRPLEEKKVNDGTINRQSLPETCEKDNDWEER